MDRYTTTPDKSHIYAMITIWPGPQITLGAVSLNATDKVRMLGYDQGELQWSTNARGEIEVELPRMDEIRSKWAWTLHISAN